MKTPCKIIEDLLPLYHDGVCSEESKMLVDEHLEECETCKDELAAIDSDFRAESAELPNDKALEAAAAAWKKGKESAFIKGVVLILIPILLFIIFSFLYHHWSNTVPATDEALRQEAINFYGENFKQYEDFEMVKIAKNGDYIAALYVTTNNQWYMAHFERDTIFKNRYRCDGGGGVSSKQIGASGTITSRGHAIFLRGIDIPDEVAYYAFACNNELYVYPVIENKVLGIFCVPDNCNPWEFKGIPIPLDENKKPLYDYELPFYDKLFIVY